MIEMIESASIIETIRELREGEKQVPYAELNQDISLIEAYKVLKLFLEGGNQTVSAWKLGGTNKKTQDAFNVGEAYYGPIFTSELSTVMGDQGMMPDLRLIQGEAEMAVRLTSFGADKRNAASVDRGLIFDQWAVAIEFPYSVFSDLPSAGIAALVVDRCAAGALMLGPSHAGLPPEKFCLTIDVNGEQESSGTQDAMLVHPIDAALEFRALAFKHGFELNAGQWISTGGLTSCLRMNRDDAVTLKYDGQLVFRLGNK